MKKYLENLPIFEIERYEKHKHYRETCTPFTGTPRKHPYEEDKLILICNPYSPYTSFFEFKIDDIEGVEEEANLVTESGESVKNVRIWVRRGSTGLRYEPFEVGKAYTSHSYSKS